MAPNTYTLTFLGDLMLGRLIDQLLPDHVHEPEESRHVVSFRRSHTHLQNYNHATPWGNTLSLLKASDLVLGNLETAATTHDTKWPDKVFNYRMHPANIACLKVARVDYVSLANNHTLDFGREGLFETAKVLEQAGIAWAGAGRGRDARCLEIRAPPCLCLCWGWFPGTRAPPLLVRRSSERLVVCARIQSPAVRRRQPGQTEESTNEGTS